jgi:hypothetical protein
MTITRRITVSLVSPIVFDITEELISSGSGPATTWDTEVAGPSLTFSGDYLTATTLEDAAIERVRSSAARSTGQRALECVGVFVGDQQNIQFGVAPASWDTLDTGGIETDGWGLWWDGFLDVTDLGLATASGDAVRVFVDFDAGEGWFDNDTDSFQADREAGTNPHFTFTPNTALYGAGALIADSPSDASSLALDPTYSSGRFSAWDA